jgi:5-methylcytosine-specific restriction enzyme subunit McrC
LGVLILKFQQIIKPIKDIKYDRPDIVLTNKNDQSVFVIDTKWKVISSTEPADNDLKQMYVYNHFWNATTSMLLYPRIENQTNTIGSYQQLPNAEPYHCLLGFVDVLENGRLSQEIGKEIIKKIKLPF